MAAPTVRSEFNNLPTVQITSVVRHTAVTELDISLTVRRNVEQADQVNSSVWISSSSDLVRPGDESLARLVT